jgi:hypothetical protein
LKTSAESQTLKEGNKTELEKTTDTLINPKAKRRPPNQKENCQTKRKTIEEDQKEVKRVEKIHPFLL